MACNPFNTRGHLALFGWYQEQGDAAGAFQHLKLAMDSTVLEDLSGLLELPIFDHMREQEGFEQLHRRAAEATARREVAQHPSLVEFYEDVRERAKDLVEQRRPGEALEEYRRYLAEAPVPRPLSLADRDRDHTRISKTMR